MNVAIKGKKDCWLDLDIVAGVTDVMWHLDNKGMGTVFIFQCLKVIWCNKFYQEQLKEK